MIYLNKILAVLLQKAEQISSVPQAIFNQTDMNLVLNMLKEINHTIEQTAGEKDMSALLDRAEALISDLDIKYGDRAKGFMALAEAADIVSTQLQEQYDSKNSSAISGLSTGFIALDNLTCGLQRGELIVVAGRPGLGKTAFAMNLVENAGVSLNLPVAVFSIETKASVLTQRMVCSLGRISSQKMKSGRMEDNDWLHYTEAVKRMSKVPVFIDDTPNLTVADIRERVLKLFELTGGMSLVVIDNLQLLKGSARFEESDNRPAEMAEISHDLKRLARELDVPIVVVSQVNRSIDSRDNRRPKLSDLSESGALESDADLVIFIYRDEVYNKNTIDKRVAEAIIAKQRNGVTGTVRIRYDPDCVRFDNLAEDVSLPPELAALK